MREGRRKLLGVGELPASLQHREGQLPLRGKEVIEAALLHSRLVAEFLDAYALVAARVKEVASDLEEALTRIAASTHGLSGSAVHRLGECRRGR